VPLGVAIGVLYMLEYFAENAIEDAQQIIDDPPRPDFQSRPAARDRPFYPETLPDDRLAQAAAGAAFSLNTSATEIRMLVAAREKAWGARLSDRQDYDQLRLQDAAGHAHRAASLLREASGSLNNFGGMLEDAELRSSLFIEDSADLVSQVWRIPTRGWHGKIVADSYMPPEALKLLYRSGVSIQALRRLLEHGEPSPYEGAWLSRNDPIAELADEYRELAKEFSLFSEELQQVSAEAPFDGNDLEA
jgi:hypothetical protein